MYKTTADISARKFIGKHATIKTCDDKIHAGFIYVVDPESGAIVITTKTPKQSDQTSNGLTIITASSVINIDIDESQDIGEVNLFTNENKKVYNAKELQQRKQKLKEWLGMNLIEVIDDGEALKFQDHLIIEPPYDLEHCFCTNTIVLNRFRSLIEKMPV